MLRWQFQQVGGTKIEIGSDEALCLGISYGTLQYHRTTIFGA